MAFIQLGLYAQFKSKNLSVKFLIMIKQQDKGLI
jgi:hypothetical protein